MKIRVTGLSTREGREGASLQVVVSDTREEGAKPGIIVLRPYM